MIDTKQQVTAFLQVANNEIGHFVDTICFDCLEKAKQLIIEAEHSGKRVHVTGIGKPAYVAGYIASLLSSTGTPAYVLNGTEAIHGSSGQVVPGDIVIAISNSGETNELKSTVKTVKQNGATIISVTSNPGSWLAQHSLLTLAAGVEQEGDSLNKPPRASIVAEILILQCLSILLQNAKKITEQQYVKWHPGGKLGQSIHEGK